MGLLISADVARLLSVTLDGRELGRWWVPEEVDDADILDELGTALVGDRPLPGPAREPIDLGAAAAALLGPAPTSARESAEDAPATAPSSEVDGPDPVDESAEDAPSAAQPVESPAVTIAPAPRVGEAEGGRATDAQVRRWAIEHHLPCSTTGAIKAWLRPEYERLDGGPPDFPTRRLARENGAEPTTPTTRPEVAGQATVATWCLRNGVEDRGGQVSVLGRQAYAEAWRAAHPEPPDAGTSASGEDPPPPDERAGRAARSGGGAVNGSVRPPIEPIGDGTGQPPSSPERLARADELAADGRTPRQICSEAGVWLSEARAAVRKASER